MISLSTTALIAVPATRFASRLASGIADVGRDFVATLNDSPEESNGDLNDDLAIGAKSDRVSGAHRSTSDAIKPSASKDSPTLADLLQAIQDLVSNLSDNAEESVTIESLSGDEVQVTGDEPLASSIKQWTKLHPEWAQNWNAQAAKTSAASKASAEKNLSARISSTAVKLEEA